MDEFVEKLKIGALKLKDEAEKFTGDVVQKTKETIDKTKYNYSISNANTRKKQLLSELGEKLYSEYKNGADFNDDVKELCVQLDNINEEIFAFRQNIAQIDNTKVCPNCNQLTTKDASFCARCGEKIDN